MGRFAMVDALRAVAAVLVLIAHLGASSDEHPWRPLIGCGAMGVNIFFVISGFILPTIMHQQGYQWGAFGRHMGKRLWRLHPPFMACVAVTLLLRFVSSVLPGYQGAPVAVNGAQLASHLVYGTEVLGFEWYSPVFWTLAIEFQFYVLLGLVVPCFRHRQPWVRGGALLALVFLCLVPLGRAWLPLHLIYFLFGMSVFVVRSQVVGLALGTGYGLLVLGLAAVNHDWALIVPALLAAALMGLQVPAPRIAVWLGGISFSLYLIHPLVFGYFNRALDRLGSSLNSTPASIAAALLATVVAWIFYRFVELPSLEASKRMSLASLR